MSIADRIIPHVRRRFQNARADLFLDLLVRVTHRWWVKKCRVADWHLLDQRHMAELFPDAMITVERFGGLPKSVIAWR
ncbi:MAG: hypothetical protein ACRELT_11310 [Longimicrobiales bacterium]